jgi:adenine-specific DNA-methyltransferase
MPSKLLSLAERNRVAALSNVDRATQDTLGQFFTPAPAAELIASMPRLPQSGAMRVLDPGAGSGMLSAALASRVLDETPELYVHLVAVECDANVVPHLANTLEACKAEGAGRISYDLVDVDYIEASTGLGADARLIGFDLVIQNPPYAKLAASSPARAAVRAAGADAPNLYAAFLALAAAALDPGGQMVAITPRSFCNGPYFGTFRSYLLRQIALDRVHVFESRSTVFADTGVLQENVIFAGTKGGNRDEVLLSASNGHQDDSSHRRVPYADMVRPEDRQQFIRITTNDDDTGVAERMMSLSDTLTSLGVSVSTGKVVDFRSRECLYEGKVDRGLPLVYPGNVHGGLITWPRRIRKPQWFAPVTEKDEKLLLPEGWYCVVKRFSAKEERRRIVAAVWSPERTPGPVAFENHLNVFHCRGAGLGRDTSFGLSMWLNSSLVDRYFRTFSGHTQVNATDLRIMRYPDQATLRHLGSQAPNHLPAQADIDALIDSEIGAAV